MAKKARGAASKQPPALSPVLKAMLDESRGRMKKKDAEGRTYLGKEMEGRQIGIPFRQLSLMYLFDSTVLGLGKIYGLAGPSQSQKSSLGFEILSWLFNAGGGARLVECEGQKYSPKLIRSLMGDYADLLVMDRCDSTDLAQNFITDSIKVLRTLGKRKTLFGLMLDSLSGVEPESATTKVEKEGSSAPRAYPETALTYTRYFKWLASAVSDLPLIFLFINHLKEVPSSMPGLPPTKTTPGGKAQRFHSATYLFVDRISRAKTRETRVVEGQKVVMPQEIRPLKLKCDKNSLGIEGRSITVDFWWYRDTFNIQHSFFDWEDATAELLLEQQETRGVVDPGPEGRYAKLQDICDVSCTGGLYTSKALGLARVEGHELGAALAKHPLQETLIDFFGIPRHNHWDGTPLPEADEIGEAPEPVQTEADPEEKAPNPDSVDLGS